MKFSAVTIPTLLILAPAAVLAASSQAAPRDAYGDCWEGCMAAVGACHSVADHLAVMSPLAASYVMLKGITTYLSCDTDCAESFLAMPDAV
ncbi:hypothetical protein CcaCcLH18_05930 [Colletotrichum camelliae]|nr:hypothetical protein CcaCcLH18_05930 [Colletotrichum camelliae]